MTFFYYSLPHANIPFKTGNRKLDGKRQSHPFLYGIQLLVVIFMIGDLFSSMRFYFPITYNCIS